MVYPHAWAVRAGTGRLCAMRRAPFAPTGQTPSGQPDVYYCMRLLPCGQAVEIEAGCTRNAPLRELQRSRGVSRGLWSHGRTVVHVRTRGLGRLHLGPWAGQMVHRFTYRRGIDHPPTSWWHVSVPCALWKQRRGVRGRCRAARRRRVPRPPGATRPCPSRASRGAHGRGLPASGSGCVCAAC